MRRLPVYIVIDTSESMIGKGIEDVNRGLDNMLASLRRNPYALETVWISIITFDSTARALVPLTEIGDFRVPRLSVRPGTSLGTAIDLLQNRLNAEVTLSRADTKGDWRPIVFFLTDGQPTDAWRPALQRLKARRPKPANIYAIGCSDEVDYHLLNELADATFRIDETRPDALGKLFLWMSSAVQSVSSGVSNDALTTGELAPPDGIERVGDDCPEAPNFPVQIFLHGTCSETKRKYLMRLKFNEQYDGYVPVASHELPEDFFSEGNYAPPPIPASAIVAMPPCPYCGNTGWGQCGVCHSGMCIPEPAPRVMICPECGEELALREGGDSENDFDVARSSG